MDISPSRTQSSPIARALESPTILELYVRPDVAACGQVLQVLRICRLRVERFLADFISVSTDEVRFHCDKPMPAMKVTLVLRIDSPRDLETFIKRANRLIDVYKVVVTHRV